MEDLLFNMNQREIDRQFSERCLIQIKQNPQRGKQFQNKTQRSDQSTQYYTPTSYQGGQKTYQYFQTPKIQIHHVNQQKKTLRVQRSLQNFSSINKEEKISHNLFLKNLKTKQVSQEWIRQNIIGFNTRYISGLRLQMEAVYVDHTATNRPFQLVETAIKHAKLKIANPHTQFSYYGKFSTFMMHQAQNIILKCFKANQKEFVAIPTGSGSTGAIQKTFQILESTLKNKKSQIYITPYEHHSNILPWVEIFSKVQVFDHDQFGNIDFDKFQQKLKSFHGIKFVSLSAASNVTSKLTNLKQVNKIIRKLRREGHQIILGLDCAAFACHHALNMQKYDQIDFVYLSPHKNLGGAQSCGVLIGRKKLFPNKPTFSGGGTVQYVKGYKKQDILYHEDPFEKQIAGTPPFLGFYRAALSFQLLHQKITFNFIERKERENTCTFVGLIAKMKKKLEQENCPTAIEIYGTQDFNKRANVVTFNLVNGKQYVHHSLVALLFTDLFGIQLRSGCFCAGPFGITLLGFSQQFMTQVANQIKAGKLINKAGYLRIDLTFYLKDFEVQYIVKAIVLITKYWQNFLKIYQVQQSGQVLKTQIFKDIEQPLFSLTQASEMQRKIFEQKQMNDIKLMKRRETLNFQLMRAQKIAQNVQQFIQKIRKGKEFNLLPL